LRKNFQTGDSLPIITIDNFLPRDLACKLSIEAENIDMKSCKIFNRNGSYMEECNDLDLMPEATDFINQFHSQKGLSWISRVTGIDNIIPDPYLKGAGYSKSYHGDCLKNHVDFNWNDDIKLYRTLTFIVYLTPDWRDSWGGHLEFTDFSGASVIRIAPIFNRAIIWQHHENCFHGYPEPINCPKTQNRKTLRLFFYKSDFAPRIENPSHRSLYYFDETTGRPTDING
jgi:hypothetical protein